MTQEVKNESKAATEYDKIIAQTAKEYRPRLKPLSKNQLINIIVELSAYVAILKSKNKE